MVKNNKIQCVKEIENQKNTEVGRSITEMLGVLAIIGVISLGSTMALNFTLNKYRTNKLEDDSYLRAFAVMTQRLNGHSPSLAQFNNKNEQSYGTFSSEVIDLDRQFGIQISGVNGPICEGIIGKVGGASGIRAVLDDSNATLIAEDCYETDNTLTLVYNRDLGDIDIDSSSICEGGCGFYGVCEEGTCVCREDHYGDRCEKAPMECENGGSWNNQTNSCDCVGTYGGTVCTDRACTTDNDCQPFLGSAYKCNTLEGICEIQCKSGETYVDGYGCCKNEALWNGGCCYTRSGYDMKEIEGIKMCCNGDTCCPEGQIYDSKTATCIPCEEVTGVIRNALFNKCNMCPNLVRVSKWQCAPACTDPDAVLVDGICICPLEKPLLPSNNPANPKCLPCDYDGRTSSDSAYGNINTGYYCNRKNGGGYSDYCAPGTVGVSGQQTITLADGTLYKETASYGSCKDCSEVDISALVYQASCESCGGTWFGDSWDVGSCSPPSDPCEGVNCGVHGTCLDGTCVCTDNYYGTNCETAPLTCENGGNWNTTTHQCDCVNGYTGTTCQVKPGCGSNADCEDYEYCKFSSGSCPSPGKIGTCTTKGTLTPYTLSLPNGNLNVYKGSEGMTRWSASNLCQSHGLQLVTLTDLGFGLNTTCFFDSAKTGSPACACSGDCSQTAKALYTLGSSGSIWLGTDGPMSCYSQYISLDYGAVSQVSYSNNGVIALCR